MAKTLADLAVGDKVKDTSSLFLGKPVIWKIADKNHSGYPAGAITLITERCIAMRCFDAKEPNNSNSDRKSYGNNRYLHSNLRQWLNSDAAAGAWYVAQHSADQAPNTANVWDGYNPYDTTAGFLNAFSAHFKAALMATTLTVAKNTVTDGGGSETVTDKIFLASNTEVGLANENSVAEGSKLALFSTDASRIAYCTTEAIADSNYTSDPANNTTAWYWWLRTPYASYSRYARRVNASGALSLDNAWLGNVGVRPLCNLNSSILVSDTTDADGCYTITWNEPPTTPPTITPPDAVYSGRTARIEWGASTDPDGDPITYQLERSYNNGAYAQVYSGAARTYDDTITTSMNTVRWRVKALDNQGNESGYITTSTISVIHNQPPEISGADGSLGVKAAAFSFAYTVTDADNDPVSVVEAVDGRVLKTYNPTLGTENMMEVSGNEWVRLNNGNHTLTVKATDTSNGSSTRTMSFVKSVDMCSFELDADSIMEMPNKPERMTIEVIREVAAGAIFTVEVCNNAFDVAPTWEDATAAVLSGLAYVFTNTVKTASKWGVNIRARIERNGAVGNCRIYGVGGYKE